jgi:hypothetical protein
MGLQIGDKFSIGGGDSSAPGTILSLGCPLSKHLALKCGWGREAPGTVAVGRRQGRISNVGAALGDGATSGQNSVKVMFSTFD